MTTKAPQKDPESMVVATAEVLEREEIYESTPVVESAIMDDARRILIGVLKAAKRQKWDIVELLVALEKSKPRKRRQNGRQGPLPSSSEP